MPCSVPSNSDILGQAGFVDREAVILAANHHPAGREFLHRVIGAVMTEFHLFRFRARRQRQQLVTEANAEDRDPVVEKTPDRGNRVSTGFGVARAIGQEYAVR